MSTEKNYNNESKRSRTEIESSDTDQNVSKRPNRETDNIDNEMSSKVLELMLRMKTMRSQIDILTERLNYVQAQYSFGDTDTVNVDASTVCSVDLRESESLEHDFSQNDLILKSVHDVSRFESKLKSKNFKAAVMKSLLSDDEISCFMDKNKVVRKVFSTIFNEELRMKFTWAGKTGKFVFKDLNEIRKLITDVVAATGHEYNMTQCDNDIRKKLLRAKRQSAGQPSLNLSQANFHNDGTASGQSLNGLSQSNQTFSGIGYNSAVTPTRGFVPDTWSSVMDLLFSQANNN